MLERTLDRGVWIATLHYHLYETHRMQHHGESSVFNAYVWFIIDDEHLIRLELGNARAGKEIETVAFTDEAGMRAFEQLMTEAGDALDHRPTGAARPRGVKRVRKKQLDTLSDAVVTYKLTQPPRSYSDIPKDCNEADIEYFRQRIDRATKK